MKWLYEATNAVPLTIKIATSGSKRLSACSDFRIRKTGASIPIGKIAIVAFVSLSPVGMSKNAVTARYGTNDKRRRR